MPDEAKTIDNQESDETLQTEKTKAINPGDKENLTQEVLAALKSLDFVKAEILKELIGAKKGSSYFQHPLVLLFLGFLLTGLVGTWLSSVWQSQQWKKEQRQLQRSNQIGIKYQVVNEIAKKTLECDVSIRGPFLETLWYSGEKKANTDFKAVDEVINNWRNLRPKCLNDTEGVAQKLILYFRSDEIRNLYEQLRKKFFEADYHLRVFLRSYEENKAVILTKNIVTDNLFEGTGIKGVEIHQLLKQLVDAMNKEIQEDITSIG